MPDNALLRRYLEGGHYVDCFATKLHGPYSQADFVAAFYTTRLFKLERLVLLLIGKPSSDGDATRLANGTASRFAAWDVEDRTDQQLLLRDFTGRTRSWLMTARCDEAPAGTRLYFGSAVVRSAPQSGSATGKSTRVPPLVGLHQRYSVWLLRAARQRLQRAGPSPN